MAVKTDFGNKQTSARRFSAIPVLFNEYCTQKINVDTKSLFVHMIVCVLCLRNQLSLSAVLSMY